MSLTHATRGVLTAIAAVILVASVPASFARPAPDNFADLAERLLPAVVNISTVQEVQQPTRRNFPNFPPGSPLEEFFNEFFNRQQEGEDPRPRRATSLGSGFIIDSEGYVVTNNHVISDATEVTVTLTNGEEYDAEIVGRDRQTDLALLKIETGEDLPSVEFGDSSGARIGDWVMTIGNPFGLGASVTAGIISARHRDIEAGPYDDFIQTDASINRGNSGGPMFDLSGKVIGVNTAIFSPTGGNIGIGFAIPSNQAEQVVGQLREFGRTRRGWLGVNIQEVTDEIAESLGLDEPRGALVSVVTPDSPADRGGVEAGDIIVEFDGQEIEEMRELPRIVAGTGIEEEVEVVVLRKGDEVELAITTGEFPEEERVVAANDTAPMPPAPPAEEDVLGMELAPMTADARRLYDLPDNVDGVVIVGIDRRSAAAERALRPGDVIARVNQEDVTALEDVRDAIQDAEDSGRSSVLLYMYRSNSGYFHVPLPIQEEG